MRDFKIVDVFTTLPFRGNPVAVVLRADGLGEEEMQAIAAWTNLSETTFHLRPTTAAADYRLRIFTPRSELPFAGHPTLGSAHALLEAGLVRPRDGKVVQECAKGLVPVTLDAERRLSFQLPEADIRPLTEAQTQRLETVLGARVASQPALVDVGARWTVAELADAATVLKLAPDLAASAAFDRELRATGTTVFGRQAAGIEVRSFAPSCGVSEDPVCGSGNGAVGAYQLHRGQLKDGEGYTATQGVCVGRAGTIGVSIAGGRVFVAGAAVTTVTGTLAA